MSSTDSQLKKRRLGATPVSNGTWEFVLWAPRSRRARLHLLGTNQRILEMEPEARGYHHLTVDGLQPGAPYLYRLDDSRELPDPASRFQPQGVHGPSHLVDVTRFKWTDPAWNGISLESSVFYELHVGTYTPEGSFEALIPRLAELASLGITTLELMPIAQFPGSRNWGYDGVFPFAPQNTYGGPEGLQRLVDAAHSQGLAVALDVVYNHLGPEGNYLSAYAPYFTDRYRTPWGQAINFDDAGSDEVRRFFIENALYWLETFHFDALRLDAIHGIFDFSANPFLAELKSAAGRLSQRLGRHIHLIAESDLNDSRVLLPRERGGYGLDSQWSDDFHHSVHTLLTGEKRGYYSDYGRISHLASTLMDGWCYSGQYSQFRQRRHGNSARGISSCHFVVSNQNHDQVGNRAAGERLSALVNFEALKLAAGISLLSPFVPLLFMGEEYGETAPFQYFTSHGDAKLVEAVRRGRREEFATFEWKQEVPDPQDENTFLRSRLHHSLRTQEPHSTLLRFYRELIRFRTKKDLGKPSNWEVGELGDSALLLKRATDAGLIAMVFNFAGFPVVLELTQLEGSWKTRIYSADSDWNGPDKAFVREVRFSKPFALRLHPHSFVVFESLPSGSEPA